MTFKIGDVSILKVQRAKQMKNYISKIAWRFVPLVSRFTNMPVKPTYTEIRHLPLK